MRGLRSARWCAIVFAVLLVTARSAAAQLTTGSLAGTVKDAQGGVIPGATVTLVSETRGTRSVPAVTNATGDFVFPNLPADTYTVEVAMPSFKTLKQTGIAVSPGRAGFSWRADARDRRRRRDGQRQGGVTADPVDERRALVHRSDRVG